MIIKKFAFGNHNEAYVESRFKSHVNIIFSNDNNKGKTLVLQGIMYSLGNEPIFPSGFEFANYYFYLSVDFNGDLVEFLRKKNSIIIKTDSDFQICHTITEFKYFLRKFIPNLPEIIKNDHQRVVDPNLFYELFFIGQDKRNTSNIISRGFYNKKDFINMIFSMSNIVTPTMSPAEVSQIKEDIKTKSNKLKALNKEIARLKINPEIANLVMTSSDKQDFLQKKKAIREMLGSISKLKRSRTGETNRKYKLSSLLVELNSLNRNIDLGQIICSDCGSDKIIYKNTDFDFEISNKVVRKSIISSIKQSILVKEEIIDELSRNIAKEQRQLDSELKQVSPTLRDVLLYKDELKDASTIDSEAIFLLQDIEELKGTLKNNTSITDEDKKQQKQMLTSLLKSMNSFYKEISPSGVLSFKDLFTKKDETYSGSEEQEFYFCKMMALRNYFKHNLPLIIDSFRDGEISSNKETLMLDIFKKQTNQVILTSTLKDEEYDIKKYTTSSQLNALDYSVIEDSQILSDQYSTEFVQIINRFNIEASS